jgi:hypothetical protein
MNSGDYFAEVAARGDPKHQEISSKQAQKTLNQPIRPDFGFSLHGTRHSRHLGYGMT